MRNGASSQKQTITTSQSKNLFASIAEDGPDAFLDLGDLGKALPEATDTLQIPGVRQEPLGEILNSQWSTVSRGKKPKTTIASKGPAAIGRKVVDPGNNANLEAEDRCWHLGFEVQPSTHECHQIHLHARRPVPIWG